MFPDNSNILNMLQLMRALILRKIQWSLQIVDCSASGPQAILPYWTITCDISPRGRFREVMMVQTLFYCQCGRFVDIDRSGSCCGTCSVFTEECGLTWWSSATGLWTANDSLVNAANMKTVVPLRCLNWDHDKHLCLNVSEFKSDISVFEIKKSNIGQQPNYSISISFSLDSISWENHTIVSETGIELSRVHQSTLSKWSIHRLEGWWARKEYLPHRRCLESSSIPSHASFPSKSSTGGTPQICFDSRLAPLGSSSGLLQT